jgi:hypothetical protein
MNLKTGQQVKLTAAGRTVDAIVILASKNGNSVMLSFDAMLLGHVCIMPVSREGDGTYRTLFTDEVIKIEVLQ